MLLSWDRSKAYSKIKILSYKDGLECRNKKENCQAFFIWKINGEKFIANFKIKSSKYIKMRTKLHW